MSFNYNPEWANINDHELNNISICPHCNNKFGNFDEVTQVVHDMDTYKVRHIPPQVIFNCFNEDCEYCDEEFAFKLMITIHAEPINPQ